MDRSKKGMTLPRWRGASAVEAVSMCLPHNSGKLLLHDTIRTAFDLRAADYSITSSIVFLDKPPFRCVA